MDGDAVLEHWNRDVSVGPGEGASGSRSRGGTSGAPFGVRARRCLVGMLGI